MAICTKCGRVLLRPERGNIRSSTEDVDGFEHKNCDEAIGPFPDNPIVDSPKPTVSTPTLKPVVKEPELEPEPELELELESEVEDDVGGDDIIFKYSTE